jgi:hypothetical protein
MLISLGANIAMWYDLSASNEASPNTIALVRGL